MAIFAFPLQSFALLSVAFAAWIAGAAPIQAQTPPPIEPAPTQTPKPLLVVQHFLTPSLDPANATNGWDLQSHGVAQTLFTMAPDGRIVPLIAERARFEDDAWTVTLKAGWKFSDGSPVDAAAVKASLERATTRNPIAAASTGKLTIDVPDARTLRVRTERPVAVMQSVLAEYPMVIHKETSDGILFTGPYRISDYRRSDFIRLSPNPHYPEPVGRVEIVVRFLGDPQARVLALESGEADLAFRIPTESLDRLKRQGVAVQSALVGYQSMMFLNSARAPLDDLRVRQAIDRAVDRATMAQALRAGEAATGFYPRFFSFAAKEVRPFDRAGAEKLLDEAGWTKGADGIRIKGGQRLRLSLLAVTVQPEPATMAAVIKSNLAAVGIGIDIKAVEASETAMQSGPWDLGIINFHAAPGGDGAFILEQLVRSTAPRNYGKWVSRDLDAVLDRLAGERDLAARDRLTGEAQAILFREVPISFLVTPVWHAGVSKRLARYRMFPSDYYIVQADMGVTE